MPKLKQKPKLYDILTELQTWCSTSLQTLAKAQIVDKKEMLNNKDINELKDYIRRYKKGDYDEDINQLHGSLIYLTEKQKT